MRPDKTGRIGVVLASGSPRRKQILEELNIPFETRVAPINEDLEGRRDPVRLARKLALMKARACFAPDTLIIGMDTLVVTGSRVLGKPANEPEAARMLKQLSGSTHQVITAAALLLGNRTVTASETTKVSFRKMTRAEIDWYVATGEPMDKAGGYGIQGLGRIFITHIDGCYFNVVGFPIDCFQRLLRRLDLRITDLMR